MKCNKHHKELINGKGKCSVPMWCNGVPAGFCDKDAFGFRPECEMVRGWDNKLYRIDGKYSGYVPYLACPQHGGPKEMKKKPSLNHARFVEVRGNYIVRILFGLSIAKIRTYPTPVT